MAEQSELVTRVLGWVELACQTAVGWISSPAAWSQFALLALSFLATDLASRCLTPILRRMITPPDGRETGLVTARHFGLTLLPLLLPVFAYAFTAAGEEITWSIFGSGDVIAFGILLFLLPAARIMILLPEGQPIVTRRYFLSATIPKSSASPRLSRRQSRHCRSC